MISLNQAEEQLDTAADLSATLDAAYACFTVMLPVIEHQQDPSNPLFVPFVMAGTSAASGRLALAAAPSLSSSTRALESAPCPEAAVLAGDAVLAIGHLAELLDRRLRAVALTAADAADRQACTAAARHAADISARCGRTPA
jgi:hypothetical protein